MKICKKCNTAKPLENYYKHTGYKDNHRSICIECFKKEKASYQRNNKDKSKLYIKKWQKNNEDKVKEIRNNNFNNKYKNDVYFAMSHLLKDRLRKALKAKNWQKNTHFVEYIGCTLNELKNHIEKQFIEGMTWENKGKWHIDHIIPLSSAKTEEELYKLCHYTNLQPLWAIDNIKKSNK